SRCFVCAAARRRTIPTPSRDVNTFGAKNIEIITTIKNNANKSLIQQDLSISTILSPRLRHPPPPGLAEPAARPTLTPTLLLPENPF
ncbi:hypothetical protein, partial [Crenobacter luteus]|uniref:hypothetical protein n=1 Tax=Crenobacter luteus TaxID=1452487 RepID=UPI001A9F5AE9